MKMILKKLEDLTLHDKIYSGNWCTGELGKVYEVYISVNFDFKKGKILTVEVKEIYGGLIPLGLFKDLSINYEIC